MTDGDTTPAPAKKTPSTLDSISKLIQVVSVVIGVVLSVLSFNAARKTEAAAREKEAATRALEVQKYYDQSKGDAERRQAEAAKPFLELRQRLYLETVQAAGVLATPESRTEEELKKARTRFRELYVAELSMVEGVGVEKGMIELARAVDPVLSNLTADQRAAYTLSHALRDSLVKSWRLDEELVDNRGR
ncbi:MAG: hypothetical protein JWO31_3874 [Phycisphaerales bacterium]|nr:hypothetical protein [Phycisphaerales bacterium]